SPAFTPGGNTCTSSERPVPSFCGISAVPMKLPGWIVETSTGLRTVTRQSLLNAMVSVLPAFVFSVRVSPASLTMVPRTTGGGPGGCAAARPGTNSAARQKAVVFIGHLVVAIQDLFRATPRLSGTWD